MTRAALVAMILAAGTARAGAPAMKHLRGAEIPRVKSLPDVDDAVGWTDATGAMAAVFSSKVEGGSDDDDGKSEYLQVDLVSLAGRAPKVLRTVRDQVEHCSEDITLDVIDGSIEVTDLDGDGTGELTFAYRVGCNATDIKLLVLEGGDKFIVRDGRPDPAKAKWPAGFYDHATSAYKRYVK